MKNDGNKKIYPILTLAVAALLLTACPLPYKYSPEGYPGDSAGADPSTPDISAAPVALYTESSGRSGALADGQSASTSSDTQIAFSSDTLGAVIYYTVDGSAPDPRSPGTRKYAPGSPLALFVSNPSAELSSASVTLRATAIGPNMKPSLVTRATITVQYPQVAAPEFNPRPGTYYSNQTVELSSPTPGAKIYFTMTTGDVAPPRPVPGQQGTDEYRTPLSIMGPDMVWNIAAIAVKDQLIPSRVTNARYEILQTCAMPELSVSGGEQTTYSNDITVSIRPGEQGSTVYCTTNGQAPNPNTAQGRTDAFELVLPRDGTVENGTVNLQARAIKGNAVSELIQRNFTFKAGTPDTSDFEGLPDIMPNTYFNTFNLVLSTVTRGATIYYTTDGSAPGTSSLFSSSPATIPITRTTRVRAVAMKNGYQASDEFDQMYTLQVATPYLTPSGGDLLVGDDISANCATGNATIWVSDDRSFDINMPNGDVFELPGPGTFTIGARAAREGFLPSSSQYFQYRVWGMPSAATIQPSATLSPPRILPINASGSFAWTHYCTAAFQYGNYTYVIWDMNSDGIDAMAIVAYRSSTMEIVREWLYGGNSNVTYVTFEANGYIRVVGRSGDRYISWLSLVPNF